MEFIVGIVLALTVCLFATVVGLDRDRAFYPTAAIVIASYYGLFAVMGGAQAALPAELAGIGVFVALATVGFRASLWYAVVAIAGHGLFDWFHGELIADPGVPVWWPGFCMTFDVLAAGYLAVLLLLGRVAVRPGAHTATAEVA